MPPVDGLLGGGCPAVDDDRSGAAEASATPGSTPSKSESNGGFGATAHADEPPSLEEAACGSSGTFKLSLSSSKNGGSSRFKPSIEEARMFEKRRKPHRIRDASQPSGFRLARLGEVKDDATGAKAEEYKTLSTPLSGLDAFGIGISLYFRQLFFLSGLFFLCGLIALPAIVHNMRFNPPDTELLARGSAAGATRADFSMRFTMWIDFAVTVLLVVFAFISRHVGQKVAAKIDESMQTAQDYAVCVLTPPPDVFDCDAYKAFFSKYGDVVSVSLALNNGALLEAIAAKKECETRLKETVEGARLLEAEAQGYGIELQPSPLHKRLLHALGFYSDPLFLWKEREQLKARVAAAAEHQSKYARVKRVFVIFATETAQRCCLQDCYSGLLQSVVGARVIASTKPQAVFRGRALVLEEPVEPSEVIWQNYRYRFWRRLLRFGVSFCCSGILLLASYSSLQYFSGEKGSMFSAVLISCINIMLPLIVKFFSTAVELPLSLSEMQTSILFKLALARMTNTAVLMYLVQSYQDMLHSTTMASIMVILVTDAIVAPTLQVLNLPQRLMQRFAAPKAPTQSAMNAYFSGLPWHLAERYTELSKTMFVSVFWSAVLPCGFFVTSAALMINFWSDKYALFNLWRRPPALNARLVTLSRSMLQFTIFVHVVMARTFFANWPYKNEAERARCGLFACHETDFMTRSQHYAVHFYSVLSVVIFCYILSQFAWGPTASLLSAVRQRFSVSGQGRAVDINYRDVHGIACYISTIDVKDAGTQVEKFVAADLPPGFPRALVPLPRGLALKEHNLCSATEVPGLHSRGDVARLFGQVRFYERDDAAEEAAAAAAVMATAEAAAVEGEKGGPEGAGAATASAESFGEMVGNVMQTAAQPLESLLLPADFIASVGGNNKGDDDHLESARDGRSEESYEAVLPDGWEKDVNGKYVDVTAMTEQEERPTQSTGWTPWRF